MSSELLKKQLEESDIFQHAIYNKETNTYLVRKCDIIIPHKGHSYVVLLDNSLIIDKGDFVTQFNWNKGKFPSEKCYKIDVEDIIGKMILCTGIGFDLTKDENILNCFWHGYLPKDKIKIAKEL